MLYNYTHKATVGVKGLTCRPSLLCLALVNATYCNVERVRTSRRLCMPPAVGRRRRLSAE